MINKISTIIMLLGIVSFCFSEFPTSDGYTSGKITFFGTHYYGGYGWVYFALNGDANHLFARVIDNDNFGKEQYAQLLSAYNSEDMVKIWAVATKNAQPAGHISAHAFSSVEITKN